MECSIHCSKDIPSHSIVGYRLNVRTEGDAEEQNFDIPDLIPGERTTLHVPNHTKDGKTVLSIIRPTGYTVLVRELD